jgi:hypothetical protein
VFRSGHNADSESDADSDPASEWTAGTYYVHVGKSWGETRLLFSVSVTQTAQLCIFWKSNTFKLSQPAQKPLQTKEKSGRVRSEK